MKDIRSSPFFFRVCRKALPARRQLWPETVVARESKRRRDLQRKQRDSKELSEQSAFSRLVRSLPSFLQAKFTPQHAYSKSA